MESDVALESPECRTLHRRLKRGRTTANHRSCYTVATLSDLDVSGGLPFNQASLPCTDFPKPLQRDHSSPSGDLCQ